MKQTQDSYDDKKVGSVHKFKIKNSLDEVLKPSMGAGAYIDDFIKSKNPQFDGKSSEKRRQMALAAYYAAKKGMKEEAELEEGYYEKPASSYRRKGDEIKDKAPVAPVPPKKKEQMKSRVGHPTNKMSCESAQKGVKVDNVNSADQEPHEEQWEPAKKNVSKLKKVNEGNMKTYKEFLQSLDEKLIGNQKKLDKNHNGKLDKQDFEMLRKEEAEELDEKLGGTQNMLNQTTHKNNDPMRRLKVTSDHPRFKNQPLNKTSQDILKKRLKSAQGTHSKPNLPEEVEQLDEYESDSSGVYRHTKKATYGTSYNDPEGAFETKDDMKKKEKQAAGRKSGQSVGSYKRRQPKAAG
jgi:hypothetical protein